MRKNNPRAGLAAHDNAPDEVQNYKFDVTTSSIHIYETVILQRIVNSFLKITPKTVSKQSPGRLLYFLTLTQFKEFRSKLKLLRLISI